MKKIFIIIIKILFLILLVAIIKFNFFNSDSYIENEKFAKIDTNRKDNSINTSSNDITKFGISYPPVKDKNQRDFSKQHLQELGVDRIRFSIHYKYIEKTKGDFTWQEFDKRMNFVKENNLTLLLTIETNGADWVCSSRKDEKSCVFKDNQYLENFVKELLQRYPNQIAKIQFGNEMLDPSFYIGTADEYIKAQNIVYQVVQKYSPQTQVVLGGFSAGVLRRFAVCEVNEVFEVYYEGKMLEGADLKKLCQKEWVKKENDDVLFILKNAKYDITDIHLYDDIENWEKIYYSFQSKSSNKRIIISEFGGPFVYDCDTALSSCKLGPTETESQYSDKYHAQRVRKYIETIQNLNVTEAYYFTLVEINDTKRMHAKSGLIDLQLNEKSAYSIFKNKIHSQPLLEKEKRKN